MAKMQPDRREIIPGTTALQQWNAAPSSPASFAWKNAAERCERDGWPARR
jgi:hypothetical protein